MSNKNPEKNYWDNRTTSHGLLANMRDKIIQSKLIHLFSFVFSTRIGDQYFIKNTLENSDSVLDVACGNGKQYLGGKEYTAGVDITGYPKEAAKLKGYNELTEYGAPEYHFEIAQKVDAVVIINLNAHVNSEVFKTILNNSLAYLKDDGKIILVNEYNNDGFSYRLFHKNVERFSEFINGMEHYFLEYEDQFVENLQRDSRFEIINRKPLIGSFLPCMHYLVFYARTSDYTKWKFFSLLFDGVFGIINSIQCRLFKCSNKSFLVGYEIALKE